MAAGAALKKINARAKALRKRHPKASYKSLQKQAGKEYKAGKLKKRPARKKVSGIKRKAAKKVVRRKTARKRTPKVKVVTRVVSVGTVKRKRRRAAPKKKATYRRKRVGNTGGNTLPILLGVGALAAVAYFALRPPATTAQMAYQPTGSVVRDSKASEIMAWASAAGIGITAITQLINALNTGSDSTVNQIYDSYKAGGDPLANVAGFIQAPYSDN